MHRNEAKRLLLPKRFKQNNERSQQMHIFFIYFKTVLIACALILIRFETKSPLFSSEKKDSKYFTQNNFIGSDLIENLYE